MHADAGLYCLHTCSVASHLGLHCLLKPVYPNKYGKYGMSQLLAKAKNNQYDKKEKKKEYRHKECNPCCLGPGRTEWLFRLI